MDAVKVTSPECCEHRTVSAYPTHLWSRARLLRVGVRNCEVERGVFFMTGRLEAAWDTASTCTA